ncbi:hypothetical protein D6D01_05477 [Aureobasidium pullulans]|uniref:Uncharacterized protein n=1 Tax=Aureobasidium pullulans TaxID=5580 RepID=A0A4S9L673_AURPU|nr:hypothetical protein D6D01_05477 [Aureobasidium pullulans]
MTDNTHPMSTRRSLKRDRASIINPTAVTSHKPTTDTQATVKNAPKTTANSTPKTPTPSKASTKKSKAAARNVKPTTHSTAGGKTAVKQSSSVEAPDAEMQDEATLSAMVPMTSTSKAAPAIKTPIPESPEVEMQNSATSPPTTSPFFKPRPAMKKPTIKQSSPMQNVDTSPTTRSSITLDKPNNNPHDCLKPKAPKRRTVSFGGATSEAATQTEDADVPVVQRMHDVYPNLPAGVPRDGDGVRESYPCPNQSQVQPTAEVKMTTTEFSGAINRAKDARKCTGGDECGDHCPLFGAEGHGDRKMD